MILLVIIVLVIDIVLSARYKRPSQPRRQRRPRRQRIVQDYDELVQYLPGDYDNGLSRLMTWNPKKQQFTLILNGNGQITK